MTDIVLKLKDHYAAKDTDAWMDCIEAADEIEKLRAALAMFTCDCTVAERCVVPDSCRNFQARRALEGK